MTIASILVYFNNNNKTLFVAKDSSLQMSPVSDLNLKAHETKIHLSGFPYKRPELKAISTSQEMSAE
jgi:hypothetical protein